MFEKDVKNQIERFDNMVHVFSTYQTFGTAKMKEPLRTGTASIQLFNDGERWWVLSMYWKNETQDAQVPEVYLPE